MLKSSELVPKLGRFLPVLGMATLVASCATALGFSGQCVLQPIAAQDGLLLANVVCEAK